MFKENKRSLEVQSPLFGVPRLIGFESPASWLTRAALSQGVGLVELLGLFDVNRSADIDLHVNESALIKIASRCSLPFEDFALCMQMFTNLKRIDPDGRVFLLSKRRAPLYRYCPVCLHRSRTKHFMLHWRFTVWRYCPLHDCMMDDSCRECGSYVALPIDMLVAGPEKKGVAYLDQCMRCGHRLSTHWASALSTIDESTVSNWELGQLLRGRSFLSAIYHGKVLYELDRNKEHGLKELLQMERKGLFPNKNFSLTATEAESRKKGQGCSADGPLAFGMQARLDGQNLVDLLGDVL